MWENKCSLVWIYCWRETEYLPFSKKNIFIYTKYFIKYIYLCISVGLSICSILFILLLFPLRNILKYSALSHKFQALLDNLTDGYFVNIDSDYLLTVFFNFGNILEMRHHKREETLGQESPSFFLIKVQSSRGTKWAKLPKSEHCLGENKSCLLWVSFCIQFHYKNTGSSSQEKGNNEILTVMIT